MTVIKVQLPGRTSIQAIVNARYDGKDENYSGDLTFHAYSDEMKARVLEQIAKGLQAVLTEVQDEPRDGEWLEPIALDPTPPTIRAIRAG